MLPLAATTGARMLDVPERCRAAARHPAGTLERKETGPRKACSARLPRRPCPFRRKVPPLRQPSPTEMPRRCRRACASRRRGRQERRSRRSRTARPRRDAVPSLRCATNSSTLRRIQRPSQRRRQANHGTAMSHVILYCCSSVRRRQLHEQPLLAASAPSASRRSERFMPKRIGGMRSCRTTERRVAWILL